MIGLLLIEISAFHGFAWAEAVLTDTDLVAGDGEAARLVCYIRADETPHVEYLQTVLSEMRDRTLVGADGTKLRRHRDDRRACGTGRRRLGAAAPGREPAVHDAEIELATEGRADADDLIDEMLSLGTVDPQADGTVVDPTSDAVLG